MIIRECMRSLVVCISRAILMGIEGKTWAFFFPCRGKVALCVSSIILMFLYCIIAYHEGSGLI
jgi:hypothetical protein